MFLEQLRFIVEDVNYHSAALRHLASTRQQDGGRIRVLVNGSPRTGTTWIQKTIASVPGYCRAGNLRGKVEGYRGAAPGDVFHGHDFLSPELQTILDAAGIRPVLTRRDPRDQTVSRMFHISRDQTHPWHARFRLMEPHEALLACIEGRPEGKLPGVRDFIRLTESWQARDPSSIHIVRYEDALENPEQEMRRLFDGLGIRISEALLKAIVARNRFSRQTVGRRFWKARRERGVADVGSHFRKAVRGDWVNHFKPLHIERFKQLAGETLIAWGYEADEEW